MIIGSGKEMKVGDKLLTGYVVRTTETPIPFILEESELSFYEDKLTVIRVVDGVPVFEEVYDREKFKKEMISSVLEYESIYHDEYDYIGIIDGIQNCENDEDLETCEQLIANWWDSKENG